ncbi:SDR family NAD(P)-dependent oxidoreductase [Phaeovulum sp.]|uniref:SDR family NAD(P)-dependent oxidoreductase n=1 Tax=Phaeovulum sp. TaxID=2934796 RepID=UPI002731A2F7|nr:SDR family NAD(P)-dependent oxidoreductase [Phaeovulum sp.]MDP1667534.1 SDR family NAD(P)-dependent oxidoreductase [Phaeovulum sp.]MDZ4120051.1 SDR family NAD(P)-dependent oxidoreductase [Phaeovulum sp.]
MRDAEGAIFVTGGSSGIGLATARLLARAAATPKLALFARNPARLEQAAALLRTDLPQADIRTFVLDVTDTAAVEAAVAAAAAALGPPHRVVLSAGITLTGRLDTVDLAEQRGVMEVNYFGSLNMVRALVPRMQAGAKLALVGSAAGLHGVYGYGGYAPSKFALRGLAEVLRVELQPRGIGVTLCLPPDTDTPMLEAEVPLRPAVTSHISAAAPAMSAEAVAAALVRGMEAGRFLVLPGLSVKLLYLFAPWIAPLLRWHQQRLIRRLGE